MRFRLAAAIAVLLLLPAAVQAAGLPLAQKTIAFKNKDVEIAVAYPVTGNARIDAVLLAYARKNVADFKTFNPTDDGNSRAYVLDITYEVRRNDGRMLGLLFTEYTDTGGVHPNTDYTAFNFLLPDGAEVFLPEIVDGARGLRRVAELARGNLVRAIGSGPDSLSDSQSIAMGTAPIADSFKDFIWQPGGLELHFAPYQVAAYAAGPQQTFIALARLRDVIRPDWRAPAPSFDCARAASPIEHAICGDAVLARLDRQTAEAYQVALKNAYEPAAQETVRQGQRAWLAARNRACGGPSPGPCLSKLYRDRLADLRKP